MPASQYEPLTATQYEQPPATQFEPPPRPSYYGGTQPPPPQYFAGPPPVPYSPPDENGKEKWRILIPIASAVVLLAAFACLYFFTDILPFGPNRDGDRDPSHTTTGNDAAVLTPAPAPASPAPVQVTPPAPSPTPPSTAPASPSAVLPGGGGVLRVNGTTEVLFTPEYSGYWEFFTWDSGMSDPFLEIYDALNSRIAHDDDSAGGFDARIAVRLNAGETYTIVAGFWGKETGAYTLTAAPYDDAISQEPGMPLSNERLPDDGGEVRVDAWTVFIFTPDHTDFWLFRTSDNWDSDPFLELFDEQGFPIVSDDDNGGDFNALMRAYLHADETYILHARFWGDGSGSYTLTVSPCASIPPEGGEIRVTETSVYVFSPARTGTWEFRTSNNRDSDPYLIIYDQFDVFVAEDDDGDEGYNSFISVVLDEGMTYFIYTDFLDGETGSYDLSVNQPSR